MQTLDEPMSSLSAAMSDVACIASSALSYSMSCVLETCFFRQSEFVICPIAYSDTVETLANAVLLCKVVRKDQQDCGLTMIGNEQG